LIYCSFFENGIVFYAFLKKKKKEERKREREKQETQTNNLVPTKPLLLVSMPSTQTPLFFLYHK